MSFDNHQAELQAIDSLPTIHKCNSLKLPETRSEDYQEMQEDTVSIWLNFRINAKKIDGLKLGIYSLVNQHRC